MKMRNVLRVVNKSRLYKNTVAVFLQLFEKFTGNFGVKIISK